MICFLKPGPSLSEGLTQLNGISRSQQIKLGLPKKLLNQRLVEKKLYDLPLNILNYGLIHPEYQGQEIEILAETEQILAINKPIKVHCHPLKYEESDNLLSALHSLGRSELLKVNTTSYDRGLLYRLDYETSGVVLLAKSEETYRQVRENFSEMAKVKKYLAVVDGSFDTERNLINKIAPIGSKGSKMDQSETGREVKISVKPIETSGDKSLVEVTLNEGARHQIRVQLSLAGHPILGDSLYGGSSSERVHLHCSEYEIDGLGIFKAPNPFEL